MSKISTSCELFKESGLQRREVILSLSHIGS